MLIALGSNLGDRGAVIERAVAAIDRELGPVLARAPLFETAPVGAATQLFLNTALVARCELAVGPAMRTLLAIEASLGRVRRERWGDRLIDLDILLWWQAGRAECTAWSDGEVTVPHPRMLERDFVLVPAAAVAPGWIVGGKSLAAICAEKGFKLSGVSV